MKLFALCGVVGALLVAAMVFQAGSDEGEPSKPQTDEIVKTEPPPKTTSKRAPFPDALMDACRGGARPR